MYPSYCHVVLPGSVYWTAGVKEYKVDRLTGIPKISVVINLMGPPLECGVKFLLLGVYSA